jgi:hypothetical protein
MNKTTIFLSPADYDKLLKAHPDVSPANTMTLSVTFQPWHLANTGSPLIYVEDPSEKRLILEMPALHLE